MFRALRILLILAVAGFLVVLGYAMFADLSPERVETRQPVVLNGD